MHPAEENDAHELFLMCDDVEALVAEMEERGIACDPVERPPWGVLRRSCSTA